MKFVLNIFTAIAKRMTPKNLRITNNPLLPNLLSKKLIERKTK